MPPNRLYTQLQDFPVVAAGDLTDDDGVFANVGGVDSFLPKTEFSDISGVPALDARITALETAPSPILGVNVKDAPYNAVGDGVTDDTAAIQAAINSGAERVFYPEGTYFLADASELTLVGDQQHIGMGRNKTIISSKNGYAFKTPAVGALDRVEFYDMGFVLRAGAVSGGAIKCLSDSYHGGWVVSRLYATGQPTSADFLLNFDGWIGSYADLILAQSCVNGIRLGSFGFVSNASTISRSRAVSCSGKAVHFYGGGGNKLVDSIIEANVGGYGVHIEACAAAQVEDCWFEDNSKADILVTAGCSGSKIRGNKIHYHHAGSTDPHISIVGPVSPDALYNIIIDKNYFADPSGSGADIELNADVAGAQITQNRLSSGLAGTIVDNGKGTNMFGNYQNDSYSQPIRLGGPQEAAYDPYYNTQRPIFWGKRRAGQTSELLLIEDESGVDLITVNSTGRLIAGAQSIQILTKAGIPVDGDFVSPADGIEVLDTLNHRHYTRSGGVWKYSALT